MSENQTEQTSSRTHYHVAANQGSTAFRFVHATRQEAEDMAACYFGGRVLTYTRYTDKTDACQYCAK